MTLSKPTVFKNHPSVKAVVAIGRQMLEDVTMPELCDFYAVPSDTKIIYVALPLTNPSRKAREIGLKRQICKIEDFMQQRDGLTVWIPRITHSQSYTEGDRWTRAYEEQQAIQSQN